MKKVLVAGAALMLAGSVVSAASAGTPGDTPEEATGVSITGDARVTYVGWKDYNRTDDTDEYADYFESRVGLNFDATAKGGTSVHARLYFDDEGYNDDAIWHGGGNTQLGVSTDYAYFMTPVGSNLTLRAGRIPLNFTPFYSWDIRPTRVQLIYKSGNLKLVPFVGVVNENWSDFDNLEDNDFMQYGIVPILQLNDAWTVKGFFRYNDDQRERDANFTLAGIDAVTSTGEPALFYGLAQTADTPHADRSGFDGSVNLSGSAGNIGFTAEVSYKAADFQGTEDDGIGAYVQAAFGMEAFTPIIIAGMTQGGFMADQNFGFVMVGGNESTTVVNVGNPYGDLAFAALVLKNQLSDRLSLQGNLLFAQYDYDGETMIVDDAIEVSGVLTYQMSESTSFTYKLGALIPGYDDDAGVAEDTYFGHLLRYNVEF
ncbi:MAG: hypothetical protein ACL93V_09885 [Candidatus Electrothrix sp. YB6]